MQKHQFLTLTFLLFVIAGFTQEPVKKKWLMKPIRYPYVEYKKAEVRLSEKEYQLYELLMDYREANGLPDIPLSKALTFVAQVHAGDLTDYFRNRWRCTFNSWSRKGDWQPCCYRKDHSKAECMWNKPRELTTYTGDGFELAYWHLWTPTPVGTLEKWKKNPLNNQVILNMGEWKKVTWNAIGIGMYGDYALVWFGKEDDKDGQPRVPVK